MKSVKDFIQKKDIQDLKNESVLELSKEKHIKDFLKENHLDPSIISEYWVEFLDYSDNVKSCMNCESIEQCQKGTDAMRNKLVYKDQQIVIELESCPYGKALEEKRELLEKYVLTNVNDELLLTDLESLDLLKAVKEGKSKPNNKDAILKILAYAKNPTPKGLYLHGDVSSGKTTLLAGLMNTLAKKGKEIGFVHFPTYLIDLKNSFATGNQEQSLDKLMKVDYLLLDGIGEENITAWSRDEVLLTILSYRSMNKLPTFFTSMYDYKHLDKVYVLRKGDEIRANTVTSKMKALSSEIMLD